MEWAVADRALAPRSEAPGKEKESGCSPAIHNHLMTGSAEERH
jgi:hypothetical protein